MLNALKEKKKKKHCHHLRQRQVTTEDHFFTASIQGNLYHRLWFLVLSFFLPLSGPSESLLTFSLKISAVPFSFWALTTKPVVWSSGGVRKLEGQLGRDYTAGTTLILNDPSPVGSERTQQNWNSEHICELIQGTNR